jgi:predicted RNase H-like HicB family nuclease
VASRKVLNVEAFWDDGSRVWVASSEDVPGLATEAETVEDLIEKLKVMIPELLAANGESADTLNVPFKLLTEYRSSAGRH